MDEFAQNFEQQKHELMFEYLKETDLKALLEIV